MSDDKLIRRGDAIAAASAAVAKYLTEDFETPPEVYIREAINAINALRAQLAEARAERDNANKIMDDWTTLHRVIADIRDASGLGSRPMLSELAREIGQRIAAANARADRAEAALAAQIEADASSDQERNYLHLHDAAHSVWKWFQIARPDLIGPRAERLRDAVIGPRPYGDAQPHDRTALDRMLAEARAQVLREAADKVDAIIRAAEEATLDERKEGLRDAHNAITRMIEGGK